MEMGTPFLQEMCVDQGREFFFQCGGNGRTAYVGDNRRGWKGAGLVRGGEVNRVVQALKGKTRKKSDRRLIVEAGARKL